VSDGHVAYLIRHAHAGDRSAWRGDDSLRPLSERGWRQAEGIARLFAPPPRLRRVVSSPSLRCVQTVEPLARLHGLPVETDERLLEGADAASALALIEDEMRRGVIAACTHGDIVPGVLDLLRSRGVRLDGQLTWPKASTWVLDGDDAGRLVGARYVPPPT
jgi:8-oxo-dGTP diphosphatase